MNALFLSDEGLDLVFRQARTHRTWDTQPVSTTMLRAIYDLAALGPTAFNAQPARFVFCHSDAARARLADCASQGNQDKIRLAPVTVIVGMDLAFHQSLPHLPPESPQAEAMRQRFQNNAELARETALRNSTLSGAYLIIAARALGLDCCPMSGFDKGCVDRAFFADSTTETNFLIAMGHAAKDAPLPPRQARHAFDDACHIL